MSVSRYYSQAINKIWSGNYYQKSYESVEWPWFNLPFADDLAKRRKMMVPGLSSFLKTKSIIEIGSSMGQGYKSLKKSGMIDLRGYVGYDISEIGQAHCRENYPETTWVEGDFTKIELNQRFEYAYERHSFHHMPMPIEQITKVLSHVDRSACFTFRGRVRGETVSDLDRARFNHYESLGYDSDGQVYFDLINIGEVVGIARANGFNHIACRLGAHEPVQSLDANKPGYWIDSKLLSSGGSIMRFVLFMAKVPELKKPKIYSYVGSRRLLLHPEYYRLKSILKEFD